jgi:L-iduronidase
MSRLEGKIAWISGAASGMGAAAARLLARAGAKVALVGRRLALSRQIASKLKAQGGEALPIACDVSNEGDQVEWRLAPAHEFLQGRPRSVRRSFLSVVLLAASLGAGRSQSTTQITVHCDQPIGTLQRIWACTHFTPGEQILEAPMRQNMLWTGAVAHHGIGLIKIHKMLSLVSAPDFGAEHPHYDWSRLDAAMDLLRENGFTHLFELEGYPSGYFTDWKDDTKLRAWRRFIRDFASRYLERYGPEEVESWYFATQNEPEGWQPESFNNYYDACSEGLKAANPQLRFGGPGTYVTLSPVLLALLRHCDTGTNYFTGEQGVRLDFINVHEKGVKHMQGPETKLEPDTRLILSRTMQLLDYIRREHPRFQHLPFMNGEADPKAGWYISRPYYSTAYYPAIIAKITDQQLRVLVDREKVDLRVALQCNAFLGGWDYRTLLTLFQANHPVLDSQEIDFHHDNGLGFDMVKKPILNLYSMMSVLGDKRVRTEGDKDVTADLGALATTRAADQVAVLLYNSADDPTQSGTTKVRLRVEHLPFDRAMLVRYEIDDLHKQPYLLWKEMGSPENPSAAQIAAMRACQELTAAANPAPVVAAGGNLSLEFDLPLPGVTLVVLSKRPAARPAKVEGVRLERCTGLHGEKELLVMWKGLPSRMLRTYEVLYAAPGTKQFRRINASDQLDAAFLHAQADGGSYKVRAVDYWGRTSPESEPVQ